jgi:hypothetical protein
MSPRIVKPPVALLVEAAEDVHPEALAGGRRKAHFGARGGDQLGDLVRLDADEPALHPDDELLRLPLGGLLDQPLQLGGEPGVRLQPLDVERVASRDLDAVDELGDSALVDRVLAERGEDMRDVLHEAGVGPDHEHAAQLLPVRVEQERRAVQADGRLAGARPALDDERRLRLAGDQVVLVGLDRRDDVAHPRVAGPLELLEQEIVDGGRSVGEGAVESLVADPGQLAAARAEAAAHRDAVRRRGRRRVEGPCRRRLPVDDQRAAGVVVHPAAPDVNLVGGFLGVDPPEAEPALRVLESAEAARGPVLDRLRGLFRCCRARGADQGLAHLVQRRVRLVEIRLLRWEIRVRHGVQPTARS